MRVNNKENELFFSQVITDDSGWMSWNVCHDRCRENGGTITSISSAFENQYINGI